MVEQAASGFFDFARRGGRRSE